MKEYLFDDEENELLQSLESQEWKSIDNLKNEIIQHQEIARNTLKKDDFFDKIAKKPKQIKDIIFLSREEANAR